MNSGKGKTEILIFSCHFQVIKLLLHRNLHVLITDVLGLKSLMKYKEKIMYQHKVEMKDKEES
jgi:hypothetical protein